jgi:uncharacterized membrane protein
MNTLTLLLRITHIVAGILWAGGAMIFFLFIEPSARSTGTEGQKFMGYLMTQKRFSKFMGAMSLLTILGGAALYYRLGNVNWSWVTTGPGVGFTIGALAGISAFAAGNVLVAPRAEKMGKLSQEIQANGGSASPEQAARLGQLEKEMVLAGKLDFLLIAIAVLTMATARYWSF